jgi:hypothetical protein
MQKNTKILLGVGALGLVAYYMWMNSDKKSTTPTTTPAATNFIGADGKKSGETCSFKMSGEIINGKISEIDSRYCFSTDGKRGLAL